MIRQSPSGRRGEAAHKRYSKKHAGYPGCYFFAFFGIPGDKEGDITGRDQVKSEDESKGEVT